MIKSPERVRLTGGRACLGEPEHSKRSICSYRKLPPPACPGTACKFSLKGGGGTNSVNRKGNPLRRSCASSARNAGESAIGSVRAQPSAEIVRVEYAECRPDKSVLQECPQECPTRVSLRGVLQECPTRVSHRGVPQECPTRSSYKSVPQEAARHSAQEMRSFGEHMSDWCLWGALLIMWVLQVCLLGSVKNSTESRHFCVAWNCARRFKQTFGTQSLKVRLHKSPQN